MVLRSKNSTPSTSGVPIETAFERVSPAMIAAAKNIFAAAALGDRAGAMAAYVAESAQRALLIADDDNRLTDDIQREESFWIGDGAFCGVWGATFSARSIESADKLPRAAEDAGFFSVENCWVGIELRRERMRGFDFFVDVELDGLSGHGGKRTQTEVCAT